MKIFKSYRFFSVQINFLVSIGLITFLLVAVNTQQIFKSSSSSEKLKKFRQVRNYLYLNYKKEYGLRYNPKIVQKKFEPPATLNIVESVLNSEQLADGENNITVADDVNNETTTLQPPDNVSMETTSVESPQIDKPITTTPNPVIEKNESTSTMETFMYFPNRRPILSFPSLVNRLNVVNKTSVGNNNASSSPSTLRNTLDFIRKRIKQWFSYGVDLNASVVNGQRFLNVFNVIKFENSPCMSMQERLTQMSGICYHDYECTEMGGISIDTCADGLGVCCICKSITLEVFSAQSINTLIFFKFAVKADCGQKTNQITSYFQNPGWPDANQDRIICTLTVDIQPDVSQVRLDFILFEV